MTEKPIVKEGIDYKINNYLPDYLIESLIKYSTDKNDKDTQTTSDPKRFANKDAINEWLKKGRIIYTLENNGELLGIFWFGKKKIEIEKLENIIPDNYQHTVAMRLYGNFRGKGLFKELTAKILSKYIESENYDNTGFWGESHNPAMIKVCSELGMKQISKIKIDTSIRSNSWENPQVTFAGTDKEVRECLTKL